MPFPSRFTSPSENAAASGSGDTSKLLRGLGRVTGLIALATSALVVSACDGSIPNARNTGIVLPDATLAKNASAISRPLGDGEEENAQAAVTQCAEFIPVEESYDELTGDFRYEYVCSDDGGDIETIITEGNDDGAGNGDYTTTYGLRDGGEEVWTVTYRLLADGISQETIGTSSEGESYTSVRTYNEDGSSNAQESYFYSDSTTIIDGVYDAEGRFSGTYTVDYLDTPDINPDYDVIHTENADGSYSQTVDGVSVGWDLHYTYAVAADGSSTYEFRNDDPSTDATPDYKGSYAYNADGSGSGNYTQLYDDGSALVVDDEFGTDGTFDQSWVFDDAGTAQDVDQEGAMSYAADGTGTGSVTTHVEGGESQTCSLSVDADGTSTTICD